MGLHRRGKGYMNGKVTKGMKTTIATIKSKGVATCPFSHIKESTFVHWTKVISYEDVVTKKVSLATLL